MKLGRPETERTKETVKVIHVALPQSVADALARLEAAIESSMRRGRTSEAIRRAILDAAARLT